jgi:hypothetical protein
VIVWQFVQRGTAAYISRLNTLLSGGIQTNDEWRADSSLLGGNSANTRLSWRRRGKATAAVQETAAAVGEATAAVQVASETVQEAIAAVQEAIVAVQEATAAVQESIAAVLGASTDLSEERRNSSCTVHKESAGVHQPTNR